MSAAILELRGLSAEYADRFGAPVQAVDRATIRIGEGRILGIAGESGCGKSTLALCAMGCPFPPLRITGGEARFMGEDLAKLPRKDARRRLYGSRIAYIPQSAMNALNPTRKLIRFIGDVVRARDPKRGERAIRELAEERFEELGLSGGDLDKYPMELSGGMRQRVAIAISAILSPDLLIADEPNSALDAGNQRLAVYALKRLMDKGRVKAMLFITHDLPLLMNVADDIAVMYAGQIVEYGPAREVVTDPIHPYSRGLMASILLPEPDTRGHKRSVPGGAMPNLKNPPPGCRYYARCPLASGPCRHYDAPSAEARGRTARCRLSAEALRETMG